MKGTIWKRQGKRGVAYTVRVDMGLDPVTGERRQRGETFRTRKEAEARLAEWIAEIGRGTAVDGSKMTVGEYLDYWLTVYGKTNLRPTTYRSYEQLIRVHIRPALGSVPLQKLTPAQLQAFYSLKLTEGRQDGKAGGLAPRSVRYLHAIIREALHQAVKWQMVGRNVADATEPPRAVRPQVRAWDQDQVLRFLVVAEDEHYGPVWLLALMTGLRRGELLGLRWEDVDLGRGVLHVRRSLVELGSKLVIQEPKTRSGRRVVALGASCVTALKAHRAHQNEQRLSLGAAWRDDGLVFTTADGGAIAPRNLIRRFKELTTQAALPAIRFHDARHTHATLLLKQGQHAKIVSERLGHANIAITLDTYSHVLPNMQRDAADDLDAALFGT
jgi:integrase